MTNNEELNDTQLKEILDKAKKSVKTENYPMALGEIMSMYERGEIILRPEYQRYFRWTSEQKSKLIESILIGLPLPAFFVAQDEEGKWEVVDGMQRLSTIFDFIGILKDENKKASHNYQRFEKLEGELFYLSEFSGKKWDDFVPRIKLDFRGTKIQLTILLRETSMDAKFELFQRLNSGGTSISGQELRNAILASENSDFLRRLEDLADFEPFRKTTSLSEKDISTRYDMELVLRFFIFLSPNKIEQLKEFNSIDVFITHILREFITEENNENFSFKEYKNLFERTFQKIYDICGDKALRYKNTQSEGKFSIAFFEAVAFGIAQNIDNLPSDNILKEIIPKIAETIEYRSVSGAGKNAKARIPALLELGKNHFKNT